MNYFPINNVHYVPIAEVVQQNENRPRQDYKYLKIALLFSSMIAICVGSILISRNSPLGNRNVLFGGAGLLIAGIWIACLVCCTERNRRL